MPNHRDCRSLLLVVLLALSLVAALLPPAAAAAEERGVTVFDSLTNLRPEKVVPSGGTSAAVIAAAGNETESFQLLVQSGTTAAKAVSVELASALSGPDGATIPTTNVSLYREGYYNVTTRSNGEGEVGQWPDALIPARDAFYGETRNAFPVEIAANGRLAVWVDIFVPAGQAPGAYSGSLAVSGSEGTIATVPVSLTVRDFTLPATSSLSSAFFLQTSKVCTAFTGSPNCSSAAQAWQADALFAEAGLNNRITIANAYAGAPSSPYFSQNFAPLVEGTDPRVQLEGAKLTSVEVYGPSCGNCIGEWKTAAAKYGFSERFFDYICDEPESSGEWEECRANAAKATSAWQGVRTLVTAGYDASAASYVTTFVPLINEIGSAMASTQMKGSYATFLSQGSSRELWLYTSCRSYSCDGTEGSSFEGWPGYAIDAPATHARAMGWLSYLYGARGELFYNTTESLTSATTNQYVSGGNGDGNLFYAGTTSGGNGSIAIGGRNPIPIESIRLKRIRDGREDYEYLRMLQEGGQASYARSVVGSIFGSEATAAQSANVSTAALLGAHEQLAAAIEGDGERGSTPVESPQAPAAPQPELPQTPEAPSTSESPQVPDSPRGPASPRHPESTRHQDGPTSDGGSTSNGSRRANDDKVRIKVIRVKAPRRARGLVSGKVKALVECDADCRVKLRAAVKAGVARRIGVSVLGRGSIVLRGGQRGWVAVRSNAGARRRLLAAAKAIVPVKAEAQAESV